MSYELYDSNVISLDFIQKIVSDMNIPVISDDGVSDPVFAV